MDHTGATSTNGTLSEFKTTANDETILTAFTADNLTTGKQFDALTTGSTDISSTLAANNTSKMISFSSATHTVTDTDVSNIPCSYIY